MSGNFFSPLLAVLGKPKAGEIGSVRAKPHAKFKHVKLRLSEED